MMKRRYCLNMNTWRIGEAEHWYADMAAQGWKLKKCGVWFTRFDRCEPVQALYRVELAEDDEETLKERRELYAQAGWTWVTGHNPVQVYTAPEGTGEIHTDGGEQAATLKALRNSSFQYFGRIITQLVILAALIHRWQGLPLISLWAQGLPAYLLLIGPAYLAALLNGVNGLLTVRRLKKRLLAGVSVDHHAPYRKSRRMKQWFWGVGGICTVLGLFLFVGMLLGTRSGPLPENHAPVILLETLEGEGFSRTEKDEDATLEREWTPLSVMYHSRERGQDGGWLIQRVMYTDHPEWTEQLVAELLPHYSMDPISEFDPLTGTGLDLCLAREKYEGMTEMAAVYEGNVMLLSYWGDAPQEKLAQLALEAMKGWQE